MGRGAVGARRSRRRAVLVTGAGGAGTPDPAGRSAHPAPLRRLVERSQALSSCLTRPSFFLLFLRGGELNVDRPAALGC